MKVVIAGGGLGGLTAALCCLHHGHEVTVLERAPALEEVGAGIQIPPNAMKVYAALGLDGALAAAGFRPQALEARMGRSGRRLFRVPLAAAAPARWGAPYLHIHRADFLAVLEQALRARAPGALKLGVQVTGHADGPQGVTAQLADGGEVIGDVLVGADGLHSAVRARMLGPDAPRFTGMTAWRAVVPMAALGPDAPPPTACVWMGPGRHCVTYRLRGGTLANFVGVVECPATPAGQAAARPPESRPAESWSARGSAGEALADFEGWHPTITGLIGAAATLYRWALFDRPPLARWVSGRVALLGDAAHPMLPFMAQGAAMAAEDAWVLAAFLARAGTGDVARALQAYERARKGRASAVQAASRANARVFHRRSPAGQIATYGPMWLAGRLAPAAIARRQDWLYAHDVTRLPAS